MIRVVFAVSPQAGDYAFGDAGQLPWAHIPQDMLNFKKRTTHAKRTVAVVMGVGTWISLPEKLPGRDNIVIDTKGVDILFGEEIDKIVHHDPDVCSFEDVVKSISKDYDDLYIIGGKSLIEQAAKFADEISMTQVVHNSVTSYDVCISSSTIHQIRQLHMQETHWFDLGDGQSLSETLYTRK